MWTRYWMPFVLLLPAALAATWIYDPVAFVATDGSTLHIGPVGRGHIVRLILNADEPDPIRAVRSDYPIQVTFSAHRAYVEFNAPNIPGSYTVMLIVEKASGTESFNVAFDVVEQPLEIRLEKGSVSVPELGRGQVRALIINRLASNTYVRLSLRNGSVTVFVPRHEVVEATVSFSVGFSGSFQEELMVKDLLNDEVYTVPLHIHVLPTLEGRIRSVELAPDFFTPLLYPARLILEVFLWLRKS